MTNTLSHTAAFGCMQFGGRADEAAARGLPGPAAHAEIAAALAPVLRALP